MRKLLKIAYKSSLRPTLPMFKCRAHTLAHTIPHDISSVAFVTRLDSVWTRWRSFSDAVTPLSYMGGVGGAWAGDFFISPKPCPSHLTIEGTGQCAFHGIVASESSRVTSHLPIFACGKGKNSFTPFNLRYAYAPTHPHQQFFR